MLPKDIDDRLSAIGEDRSVFENLLRSEGERFVRGYLERIEDAESLYQRWAPKVRHFTEECRTANPCPAVESLSDRDAAKLAIYRTKIESTEKLPRKRNEVVYCVLPSIAHSVAQSSWIGNDDRTLILTPEESGRWQQIYSHPEGSFRWWVNYWWDIQDPPGQGLWSDGDWSLPAHEEPWLVISGLAWGDLAGGEDAELYSWDGAEAKYCRHIGAAQF
jgi:hypothetical protein